MATYNGWTNYETWVTKLWMDNDEGSYRYWQEVAEEYARNPSPKHGGAVSMLADALKDQHEEMAPKVEGVFADLLNAAIGEVNWHEIAESLLSEVEENAEE